MKKFTFGLVFVMIIFGLMLMTGCPTDENETKEPVNPYAGLTVAEQYRGDYTYDINRGFFRISKNEAGWLSNDTNDYPERHFAYTDANANLMFYGLSYSNFYEPYYWDDSELHGYFSDNQTFTRVYEDGTTKDYFRITEN